ncbi:MAG TPA: outer membrane beta-barrel protein [Ramlibacter sp.]|nr:outer membrane beta-barrel protein [Ramlibacter sp.]
MISSKTILKQTALALCACAIAGVAYADHGVQPAYYLGLQGGQNNLRGAWDATVSLGPSVSLPGIATTKRGTHFGVLGGRQTEHARFEVEYQHGGFDITGLQLGPVSQAISAGGHYDALTANAYRVEPVWDKRVNIYAALGVGWGRVSMPQMGFTAPPCNCFVGSSKSGVTWLARAGAEYNLGEQDKLFLQYTYLALPRPGSGGTPGTEYSRKNVGAISLGYRHNF